MRRSSRITILLALLLAPAAAAQLGGGAGGGLGGANNKSGSTTPPPTPVPPALPDPGPDSGGHGAGTQPIPPRWQGRGGGGFAAGPQGPPPTNRGPGPMTGAPPPPGTPGATAPGAGGGAAIDALHWRLWWELNQHQYLRLKEAAWNTGSLTKDSGFWLGDGSPSAAVASLRPSESQIHDAVAPALRAAIEREGDPAVRVLALHAYARLGELPRPQGAPRVAQPLLDALGESNPELAEVAVLSLGLRGERDLLFDLASLLLDEPQARALTGRSRVPARMRAYAAYALGLAAERDPKPEVARYVVSRLVEALESGAAKNREVGTACANALALLRLPDLDPAIADPRDLPPHAGRELLVRYMLGLLRDRNLDVDVRAHLPRAIVRQLRERDDPLEVEVADALLSLTTRPRLSNRELRWGAVQALGLLGDAGPEPVQERIRAGLQKAYTRGDPITQNLALIAIARVSARPGGPTGRALTASSELRDFLFQQLERGKSRQRPWAALALGVRGYHLAELGLPQSQIVTERMIELLAAEGAPDDVGALAVGLGLRGDIRAADTLREKLETVRVDVPRGECALALGLVQSTHSADRLRELLGESEQQPYTLRAAATALMLLGDKQVCLQLTKAMDEAENAPLQARYAWALAWTGDARAIDPLVELLARPKLSVELRAYVTTALGWVAEPRELPWSAHLASDANYAAAPPTLYAPEGGGVLNLP